VDDNFAHVTLLIDRSGSMEEIRDDAQGGVDSFVKIQQDAARARDMRISLSVFDFDTEYRQAVHVDRVQDWKGYKLEPRGATALLDSIVRAITNTGEYLGGMTEQRRPAHVTFVIVTDGLENSSREATKQQVNELITEHSQKYGWSFIFLAANQDAIEEGTSLGVPANNSMNWNKRSAGSTYAVASNATVSSYSSTPGGQSADFDLPENAPEK